MFRILNRKRKVVGLLQNPIEPRIEEVTSGMYELYFSVSSKFKGLELEGYIQIENEHEYVIKEIVTHGTNKEVVAIMNVEEITGNPWITFRSTNTNPYDCMREILSGTNWRVVNESSITSTRNLHGSNTTSWDLITTFCSVYSVEVKFDTYNKVVTIVDRLGDDLGVYFINDLNLKQLNHDSHTHKYVTQIIPIGKNDLTIESINNNKLYVSNYSYTDKKITGIWKADYYTDKQALKQDAQKYLDELAIPYETYECLIVDLNRASGMSNFAYNIGDTITLIDSVSETRVKQRIIKQVRYLTDPSKNTIQIANKNMTFQEYYKRLQLITDMAEQVMNSDGTISSSKIEGDIIAVIQADSIEAHHIKSNQIFARHIVADNVSAEHIKANSIDTKHLKANIIQAGHIQAGAIQAGSGIIAEGAIGDAQISNINANKIDAGEIDTSKIRITGENGFLFIENNTLYVVDSNRKIRCELGVIEENTNYGFIVRGADGQTILLDHNGVRNAGITDGAVDNRTVSENANISGKKLDINSVIRTINEDGSVKLQGTVVQVGNTTLDVKLSEQNNLITEHGKKLETQQSSITSNTEAIKLKVDNQTYIEDKQSMNSKLEKHTSDIEILQDEISLKVEQTDIENVKNDVLGTVDSKIDSAKTEIKATTDSLSSSVTELTNTTSSINGTLTEHASRIQTAESKLTKEAITNVVSENFYSKGDVDGKGYQTSSQVQQTVDKVQFSFVESGGYNRLYNSAFKNGFNHWIPLSWNDNGASGGTSGLEIRQIGDEWALTNRNVLSAYAYNLTTVTGQALGIGFDSHKIWGGIHWTLSCMLASHRANYIVVEICEYDSNGNRFIGNENSWRITNIKGGGQDRNSWIKFHEKFSLRNAGCAWFQVRIFLGDWNGEINTAYLFMAEPMLALGHKDQLIYTPNADELYSGITTVDKDGIKVQHESGSYSRMNAKEFYQAKEDGNRTISMRLGAMRTYQFPQEGNGATNFLGGFTPSRNATADRVYGNTLFGSSHCGFMDIGFSENGEDNQNHTITPWLRCVHYTGNANMPQGVHTHKPLHVRHHSYYYYRPEAFYGIGFPYEGRDDLNSEASYITTSANAVPGTRYLHVWGADGVKLGVQNGGTKIGHQMIEEGTSVGINHSAWGNWDFNGWSLNNARVTYSLANPVAKLSSRERQFTRETTQIMSTKQIIQDRGEDFTSEGQCIIEIPDDIKYNIGRYDVNIIKYGRGDIWVSERTFDYFIVESDNDIKFTWVLEGELIETKVRAISNYSFDLDEEDSTQSQAIEEVPVVIGASKYATMDDDQIQEALLLEELQENKELWKLYKK